MLEHILNWPQVQMTSIDDSRMTVLAFELSFAKKKCFRKD